MSSAQQSVDLAARVQEIGFTDFTISLLDGVYDTLVSNQIEQLKAYSELVQQVSGTVEEFVLNVSGLDVAGTSGITTGQNGAVLESYIADVLALDASASSHQVTPTILTHFAPAPLMEGTTELSADDTISKNALKEAVFSKIKSDMSQQYDLLTELVRIGYARLDTTGGFVETGLDFRVRGWDAAQVARRSTAIRTSDWYVNGSVGASFKKWGFRVNGGYSASNLSVSTTSQSAQTAVSTDINLSGRVRVEFATATFDTSMARVRSEADDE